MEIFVGNLSFDAREEDVRKMFEPFGTVAAVSIIMKKRGDKSRGFGFVDMPDEAQAKAAIAGLNGVLLMERPLKVVPAIPEDQKEPVAARPPRSRKKRNARRDDESDFIDADELEEELDEDLYAEIDEELSEDIGQDTDDVWEDEENAYEYTGDEDGYSWDRPAKSFHRRDWDHGDELKQPEPGPKGRRQGFDKKTSGGFRKARTERGRGYRGSKGFGGRSERSEDGDSGRPWRKGGRGQSDMRSSGRRKSFGGGEREFRPRKSFGGRPWKRSEGGDRPWKRSESRDRPWKRSEGGDRPPRDFDSRRGEGRAGKRLYGGGSFRSGRPGSGYRKRGRGFRR